MKISGSQVVIECLVEQGVDTIFGYPGGAILNIYDELYKNSKRIRHILTAHEQAAAHAADGYARSTGKVGVCMATSGPGATESPQPTWTLVRLSQSLATSPQAFWEKTPSKKSTFAASRCRSQSTTLWSKRLRTWPTQSAPPSL